MACSDVTVPVNAPCDFSCLSSGDQWAVLLRLYLLRYGTELAPSVLVANSTCIANCIPQGAQLAVLLYLEQQIAGSTATPQQLIDEAVCQNFAQSAGMALPTLLAFMQEQLPNTDTASQLANDSRCLFSCIPEGMFLPALIYVAQLTVGNTQTASGLASSASSLINIFPGSYYISTIRRIMVVSTSCTADLLLTQALTPVQTTYLIGDTLTFTITVQNNGPDTATSLSVAVALPAMVVGSLTVSESYTSSGAPPTQVLTVPLAALANGASKVFTVAFTLLDTITTGTFSLTSTATGQCTDIPADSTKTTSFATQTPPTDMKIWVDASVLTEANNATISPWLDLSGNANNLVVTSGSLVVKTNIQNGYRGVLLGASAGATSAGPTFVSGGPMTVIGVWKHQVAPGLTRAVNMLTGNFGIGSQSDTQLRCVWVNGVTTALYQLITAASTARVQTYTSNTSGTSKWIAQGGGAVTTNNQMPAGRMAIGSATIPENMLGHMFELRVWNRVLTDAEISATVSFLTSKWALTADPTPSPCLPSAVANLETWIKSDTLPGADGSTVSTWADSSGNANNFGSVAGTPTLRYNSQNGLKGVEFAAGAGLTGTYSRAAGAFTVILVAKSNSTSGTFRRTIQGSANWLIGPYSNVWQVYNGSFFAGNGADLAAHTIVVTQTAGSSKLYIDRAYLNTNAGAGWPSIFCLGRNGIANESFLGLIYEVAIYSRVLSATEILNVTDALRTKWATP